MKKNAGGFTLIELMISVALIGILSSIAIPAFNNYRHKSNDATAHSDAKGIMQLFLTAKY